MEKGGKRERERDIYRGRWRESENRREREKGGKNGRTERKKVRRQ